MTDISEQARAELVADLRAYAGTSSTSHAHVPTELLRVTADALAASLTPEPSEDVREAVRNALATVLDGQEAMHCTRDWSAWAHGAMTTDDFAGVTENEDALNEIVDAVMHALALTVTPKPTNDHSTHEFCDPRLGCVLPTNDSEGEKR